MALLLSCDLSPSVQLCDVDRAGANIANLTFRVFFFLSVTGCNTVIGVVLRHLGVVKVGKDGCMTGRAGWGVGDWHNWLPVVPSGRWSVP